MIKGFIVSLIVAAAFFAAGGISVSVLGTRSMGAREFADIEVLEEAPGLVEIIEEDKVVGEEFWEFELSKTVAVVSSSVDTRVVKASGDMITLSVRTKGKGIASVTVAENRDGDGYIGISVRGNTGFFYDLHTKDVEVTIGLPDAIYDDVELMLGSGELRAADIKANSALVEVGSGNLVYEQPGDFTAEAFFGEVSSGSLKADNICASMTQLDLYSGKLEYTQARDFHADMLMVSISSGKLSAVNADTTNYRIEMGSGNFEVSGLTGSGEIDISSGNGSAEFAEINENGNIIDISSGKLDVYVPKNCKTQIAAEIATGSVSIDCCGVTDKLKDDETVWLGGGGKFSVDVSSGKVSFLDSKSYVIQEVTLIDNGVPDEIPAEFAVVEGTHFITS